MSVFSGMVVSVHKRGEKKLLTERQLRIRLQSDLEMEKDSHKKTKQCMKELILILERYNIEVPDFVSKLDNN